MNAGYLVVRFTLNPPAERPSRSRAPLYQINNHTKVYSAQDLCAKFNIGYRDLHSLLVEVSCFEPRPSCLIVSFGALNGIVSSDAFYLMADSEESSRFARDFRKTYATVLSLERASVIGDHFELLVIETILFYVIGNLERKYAATRKRVEDLLGQQFGASQTELASRLQQDLLRINSDCKRAELSLKDVLDGDGVVDLCLDNQRIKRLRKERRAHERSDSDGDGRDWAGEGLVQCSPTSDHSQDGGDGGDGGDESLTRSDSGLSRGGPFRDPSHEDANRAAEPPARCSSPSTESSMVSESGQPLSATQYPLPARDFLARSERSISDSDTENTVWLAVRGDDIKNLFEAYLVQAQAMIEGSQDLIQMIENRLELLETLLDEKRNRLMHFELHLTFLNLGVDFACVLASALGMNVYIPGQGNVWVFFIVSGVIILIGAGVYVICLCLQKYAEFRARKGISDREDASNTLWEITDPGTTSELGDPSVVNDSEPRKAGEALSSPQDEYTHGASTFGHPRWCRKRTGRSRGSLHHSLSDSQSQTILSSEARDQLHGLEDPPGDVLAHDERVGKHSWFGHSTAKRSQWPEAARAPHGQKSIGPSSEEEILRGSDSG